MKHKYRVAVAVVVGLGLLATVVYFISNLHIPVLQPKGLIAHEQRNLLLFAAILSLFVIIPVYALTITIAWRYRAQNKKAKHTPDWEKHNGVEFVMWAIPCAIILVLSVVTWKTSHSLDPFKPLSSTKKPLTVQVVALQWKWLFIYPEQKIATVNYFQIPEDTPVNFVITSDAPMNSFWIPELGGQIYAMAGMQTKLHLIADEVGRYRGSSANISGEGFADMKFVAEAVSEANFKKWTASVQASPKALDLATYQELAKPSESNPVALYTLAEPKLQSIIIAKYMAPHASSPTASEHAEHESQHANHQHEGASH